MTTRRELLIALGACALPASFDAYAQQQGKVWRVGVLNLVSRPVSLDSDYNGAFVRAMRDLGYVEGKNLVIEWRWAEGKAERLPGLAAELARLKLDVIVSSGANTAISAAQKATTSVPIVVVGVGDPVKSGYVKSLERPGGNITGISNMAMDVISKRLEMLIDMVPTLSQVVLLTNPESPASKVSVDNLQTAARSKAVTVLVVKARTMQEIDSVFSQAARQHATAIIVPRDTTFNRQGQRIAELAAKHRLPTVGSLREYAEAGGLMSYGSSVTEQWRRAATYVDKIFKGAKPGDLPVEQPMKLDMVVNRKTAKALGLTIPQSLLISAEMIE